MLSTRTRILCNIAVLHPILHLPDLGDVAGVLVGRLIFALLLRLSTFRGLAVDPKQLIKCAEGANIENAEIRGSLAGGIEKSEL